MVHPDYLNPKPSYILAILGGFVGMLILIAVLSLAPVLGAAPIEFAHLIGGIFTSNPELAFWIGFTLFFLTGIFMLGLMLPMLWLKLPGRNVGFSGALVKGLVWGFILAVLSGLLMPAAGLINRLPQLENPGLFFLEAGFLEALLVLVAHLLFGIAVALIAAMPQGISPLDTLGWDGIDLADTRDVILIREGWRVPGK